MKPQYTKNNTTTIVFTRLIAEIHSFPRVAISVCLEKMLEAVPLMNMKVVGSDYVRNPPCAYVILATSHMALHVLGRPRQLQRFAYLDIFTCGDVDVRKGYQYLKKQIGFSNDFVEVYREIKKFPKSSVS